MSILFFNVRNRAKAGMYGAFVLRIDYLIRQPWFLGSHSRDGMSYVYGTSFHKFQDSKLHIQIHISRGPVWRETYVELSTPWSHAKIL